MDPNTNPIDESLETLESTAVQSGEPSAIVINTDSSNAAPTPLPQAPTPANKPGIKIRLQNLFRRFNIYLLLFVLVIIISIAMVVVSVQRNRSEDKQLTLDTQELTQATLDQLKGTDTKVGDPKQLLSIESNAVFTGKVLIRDSLDVAGPIKVGGSLTLPGITVSGASNFDQVLINSLQITGNTAVQGGLTVQQGLNVAGNSTFSGNITASQLTLDTLQLNGELKLNRHIDAGGGLPGASAGNVGAGGTVSISGTDTAGTVTFNTGSGPGGGTLATITFASAFSAVPHVVITPVGSGGAGLNYYITRTTTGFTIASTNAPSAGISFSFDYIVID